MKKMQILYNLLNDVKKQEIYSNSSMQLVNNNLMRNTNKSKKTTQKQSSAITQKSKLNHNRTNDIKTGELSLTSHKKISTSHIVQEQSPNKNKNKQISKQTKVVSPSKKQYTLKIPQSQRELLKQLYQQKCKNLSISFNQQKFIAFLLIFQSQNQSNIKNSLNLSGLSLVSTQSHINRLIPNKIYQLNLSKSIIDPTQIKLELIKKLYLNNCGLNNQQIQSLFDKLMKTKQITALSLSSPEVRQKNHLTKYEKLYELISSCDRLAQLYLSSCSIRKDTKIFSLLKSSSIRILDLSHNQKVVGISSCLQKLNLEFNLIQNPDALFTNECKSHNQLTSLNISSNPIPHYKLSIFLKQGYLNKLTKLKMNNLRIHQECPPLQQFICYANSLKKLSMINCELGEQSWRNVCMGLMGNHFLEEVDLSHNQIKSLDTAKLLGQVFQHSPIKKISLVLCQIKDVLGPLIFADLEDNSYLEIINIQENKLSAESGKALSLVLKKNYLIKVLNIENNLFSYSVEKQINEYISRNRFLQAQNVRKQFDSLTITPDIEIRTFNQLNILQSQLKRHKQERMKMEETVYRAKTIKLNQEINTLKGLIKKMQADQNQLIQDIQELQNDIFEESPMNSSMNLKHSTQEKENH